MKNFILFLFLVLNFCYSQTKRVLFLGNSYTNYFDLPQLLVNTAQSTNDLIVVESNTPGGHTLQNHNSNSTSLSKIAQGNWDFVVLQEQSQLPSFPITQVENQVFPFAQSLNNTIVSQNPCAETVFYMTWGRQNGDTENCSSNPPVCTYVGMDNLLKERYLTMTNDNNAIVSPVSVVWKYLRTNYPTMNLYDPDGSHPSILGSYVAACCFYTTILRKNPLLITFNASLSSADAAAIKMATKNLVFDNLLTWKVGNYDPISNFTYSSSTSTEINFINNSSNSSQYLWNFGDNTTSNEVNPNHSYASTGQYLVKLTATKCSLSTTSEQTIETSLLNNNQNVIQAVKIYPNPTKDFIFIETNDEVKSIEIYDVYGRLIDSLKKIEGTINFTDKNIGVYYLKFYTKNETYLKRIIKQ